MVRVISGFSNILMCLLVVACSSGGGGGGGGSGGGEGRLTIAQNNINITAEVDGPNLPDLEIRGTISGVDQRLYLRIDVTENGMLTADFIQESDNSGVVYLTPKSPALLGEGIYNDILVVNACLDAACSRHLAGSPKTINVQYRVLDTIRLSAESIYSTFDIFEDSTVFSNVIALRGVQGNWSVVSDQPWLSAAAASGVGSQDVTIVANAEGLAPGMNKGTLTFTELATQETTTFVREIFVQEPSITLAGTETVELFADGVSSSVHRTLVNEDLKAFELLVDAPDWLDVTMGLSPSFQRQVIYKVNTNLPLTAGEYTGEVRLYLEIGGVKVGPTVPVTLKVFPSVLTLSDRGIALVHNSLASKLSETVEVSIGGQPTSDWQVTVEYLGNHEGWLTVAPNLANLHEMVISAEPDGIANGETAEAIIRVTSQDGALYETLRVGLNVATDLDVRARTVVELETTYSSTWMEADPVRPLLYVANGSDTIEVYHVYTGELVQTFVIPNAFIRHFTLASDGGVLYSLDERNVQIARIDLSTGLALSPLQVTAWQECTQCENDFYHLMIKYVRAYGRDLLITNTPHLLNAETGELLNHLASGDLNHAPQDGQLLVATSGQRFLASSEYHSDNADLYSVTYAGGGKYSASILSQWQATSRSRQYSLSRTGTRIYDRCSYPEGLSIYSTDDMALITPARQDFDGAAHLISDTELLCISYFHTESNPSPEIWRIHIETGALLEEYSVGAYVDYNQHIVSGDGQRLITRSEFFRLLTLQPL